MAPYGGAIHATHWKHTDARKVAAPATVVSSIFALAEGRRDTADLPIYDAGKPWNGGGTTQDAGAYAGVTRDINAIGKLHASGRKVRTKSVQKKQHIDLLFMCR